MDRLDGLIEEIKSLERELVAELQKKQDEYLYIIKGKKIQFEEETRRYHRTLSTRLQKYVGQAPIRHLVTAPLIWSCLVPALMLDLVVSVYHSICFRVYRIPLVRRADYIVIDREALGYLNAIEKLNCVYCGYFSGLINWVQEIAARTEQYWCPIKHARKLTTIHSRYHKFLEYGAGDQYRESFEQLRGDFRDLGNRGAKPKQSS